MEGRALDDRPWAARENRTRRRRRKMPGAVAAGEPRWWPTAIGRRGLSWQSRRRWVQVGSGDSGGHRPGGFGSWRLGIGYGGRPAAKTGSPDDEKGGGAKMQGQLSRLWSARLQDGKGQVDWYMRASQRAVRASHTSIPRSRNERGRASDRRKGPETKHEPRCTPLSGRREHLSDVASHPLRFSLLACDRGRSGEISAMRVGRGELAAPVRLCRPVILCPGQVSRYLPRPSVKTASILSVRSPRNSTSIGSRGAVGHPLVVDGCLDSGGKCIEERQGSPSGMSESLTVSRQLLWCRQRFGELR